MPMSISTMIGMLEHESKEMLTIMSSKEWKYFKFGNEGPYKRHLTKLQKMANENDPYLFQYFGDHSMTSSFELLISMALKKENEIARNRDKEFNSFLENLERMKDNL